MNSVSESAEHLGHRPTPSAATDLVAVACGQRAALEDARDVFVDRLHRASDDYDATAALALVYRAINAIDTQHQPAPVPSKPARRWSRRRRAERRRDAHDHDRDVRVATRAAAARTRSVAHRPEPIAAPDTIPVQDAPRDIPGDPWAMDRAADDGWPAAPTRDRPTDVSTPPHASPVARRCARG